MMAKHTNKLFGCILALSCAFVLGACDPVDTLPANYNQSILVGNDGESKLSGETIKYGELDYPIDDNILGSIYGDVASNRNETILQMLKDIIINEKYGSYNDIKEAGEGDDTKKLAYINAHSDFFVQDGDNNDDKLTRFNDFYEDIKERISEEFYSLITSGTYNDPTTGMFDEKNLVTALNFDLWDLTGDIDTMTFKAPYYVTAELKKEEAFSDNWLTTSVYSAPSKARGYIEKKVFPKIIQDKLIEQYIYSNEDTFNSLGRSYARKVNYVKVPYTSQNMNYVDFLVKEFNNTFIYKTTTDAAYEIPFENFDKARLGFDKITCAEETVGGDTVQVLLHVDVGAGSVAGTADNTFGNYTFAYDANKAYYEKLQGDTNTPSSVKTDHELVFVDFDSNKEDFTTADGMYIFNASFRTFADTKLGELLKSYNLAIKGKSHLKTITSKEKVEYDKFKGGKSFADTLRDKILALAKEDNTTYGWYVKNGGISDLPSALRDRLFNVNVANDFDKDDANGFFKETLSPDTLGDYRYKDGVLLNKVPYLRNIEGRKLVLPTGGIAYEQNPDNFVYSDGSNYYICQVLEAPSTAKLNKDNEQKAYKDGSGNIDTAKIEKFARSIAKILSTKDTYATRAFTEYLNKFEFKFYNTSFYEYLKGQYPDLDIFDED